MPAHPKVLVVDDELHIRELVAFILEDSGYEIRGVPDGFEALRVLETWTPDVILLDIMMPRLDGFELLPKLRQLTDAPVIVLSARGDVQDRVAGLVRGADDYVSKPFDPRELEARIAKALRRPKLAATTLLRYADLTMDLETHSVTRGSRAIHLTRREFDLLQRLMRFPRRVFSRDELIEHVWGSDSSVGTGVIETYVSYLRAKIDSGTSNPLIRTLRGVGYSLRDG
ncbi:MAG TPA: response regulator transcription factor [Candidatus Dormibacteraeota bacterium]|nr:response regulator transcription factor [Candidatus Dormibacteraeota bacterium]